MNKDKENEMRDELNEQLEKALSNLLLATLAKFMIEDIDNDDMEVANNYISKLRIMLLTNNKKGK